VQKTDKQSSGLVNQVLSYLLQMSLNHISTVLLTTWMALPTRYPGIQTDDFEIEDELTKPWIAVYNFSSKLRRLGIRGIKWSAWMRFLLSLAAAMSVLLLGAAINIIALPKLRWWPNSGVSSVGVYRDTPVLRIQDISWGQFESGARTMFAGNEEEAVIGDVTNSLIAASIFPALGILRPRFANASSSWINAYTFERHLPHFWGEGPDETDGLVPWPQAPHGTGITAFSLNGNTVQTVSLQAGLLADMWVGFQKSGDPLARDSIGIDASLHTTLPLLSTSCQELPAAFNAPDNTVVTFPSRNSTDTSNLNTTISIQFPPVTGFNGAFCNISLQQVIFGLLIMNDTSENYDRVTMERGHGQVWEYLPVTQDDVNIMTSLANQLVASLPKLEALSPAGNFTQMARRIGGGESVTAGFTAVVSTTLQNFITVAEWSTFKTGRIYVTGPIQFRIYGSGPRLMWEWVIGKPGFIRFATAEEG
jgi:hypothetical protein